MKYKLAILILPILTSCFLFKTEEQKFVKKAIKAQEEQATSVGDEIPLSVITQDASDTNAVFQLVETMPEYPGGMDSMLAHLGRTINYPKEAKDEGVQGKVYAQFIVEKDGSLSNIKIVKGIGSGCDEEALNSIKKMPNWIPGMQRGKPVRVQFILPINFTLRESKKDKN